jgi:Glu-tRNA(Gln) amidotransferase subunit E-like FAD-binding protein
MALPAAGGGRQEPSPLLSKFDPDAQQELLRRMSDGSITNEHVVQLYRLLSCTPEERDADSIAELLDLTEGMAADEFGKWVDERIARWKDQ